MPTANVELVLAVYDAFTRRNQDVIARLVAPDIVIEQSDQLPWGGRYEGIDGLGRFYTVLMSHVTSAIVFECFLDAGDHVVAIGRTQGTTVANAQPFDIPIAHLWKIANNRIVQFRPYIDNPTMLAALSSVPA